MDKPQIAAAKARLMERLPAMREAALGQAKTMRLDKKTTVTGVITEVEFGYWGFPGAASLQMVFKITMACGVNKTLKTFHCRNLPA